MKRRAPLNKSPKAAASPRHEVYVQSPKKSFNGGEVPVGDDIAKPSLSVVKRVVAGISMIGLFGLIIYGGHLYVTLLVVILQTLIFRELVNVRYRAAAEKNIPWFRSIQWCWFGVALLYNYGDSFQSFLRSTHTKLDFPWLRMYLQYHTWVSFSLYATLFVFSVLSLKKGYYKYQMGQLTWTIVTLCLIVFQMRSILDNIFKGLVWLFFPASLVVCNDCFAYFCGKLFGKRFIKAAFLKLSPNKTWEGFLGAFVCTVAFGFWSSALLAQSTWMTCPLESIELMPPPLTCTPHPVFIKAWYALPAPVAAVVSIPRVQLYPIQVHSLVFACFTSVISPFGGFYASAIKRAYKLKVGSLHVVPGW
ncbi:hypothetical protein, variant [Aphanomyces invadans]|uniref:phosphatidate cytidylyltransferase n=1 Tax=Aphanomyces invadans TaxID=157072 RepID=A0A024TVL3_9STRA|nr:hypothetical protein, variant [Aphanomyces invadans]ETV97666.1 hypothetical protein, variant [Aphanomyces invadans]|eukprot:XP_008873875.1 hypothetical protein, variant [Aphanomyces invadans]